MPSFGPVNRRGLIRHLKQFGFKVSSSGGKHQFMVKGDITLGYRNPHQSDIGKETADQNPASGRNNQGRVGKAVGTLSPSNINVGADLVVMHTYEIIIYWSDGVIRCLLPVASQTPHCHGTWR